MKKIESKIVDFRVSQKGKEVPVPVPDIDPYTLRIDSRPAGALQAVAEKIDYFTLEGRKRVYLIVSFIEVEGMKDGHKVSIERPIEFFVPNGQLSSEHQWITATMRNLSLAARAGFVDKALADLRKVAWDKGPVRLGINSYDKPAVHDSEVAAVAWAIQQIITNRRAQKEQSTVEGAAPPPAALLETEDSVEIIHQACPECGGKTVLKDGCPTCIDCGHSKCG